MVCTVFFKESAVGARKPYGGGGSRRTVLQMHLGCRPIGGFAHPYVEVFALARFEEEDIVAVVEFGDFVELVEFCFGVEFCVFAAVGEEGVEVIEEMTMSAK